MNVYKNNEEKIKFYANKNFKLFSFFLLFFLLFINVKLMSKSMNYLRTFN